MPLKKSFASYFKEIEEDVVQDMPFPVTDEKGKVLRVEMRPTVIAKQIVRVEVPQEDIDMGPLEEAAMLAEWACGKHMEKRPNDLTIHEKVDILSDPEKGAPFVAAATKAFNESHEKWLSESLPLEEDRKAKWKAYHDMMATMPPNCKTC